MSRAEVGQVVKVWIDGRSHRRLARDLGVTRRAVQQWAAAICLPRPERVPALGVACGRPEAEIAAVVAALS